MKTHKTDTELILPGKKRSGDGICVFGYIFRAALAFFCAFSFTIFTADSLRSSTIPAGCLESSKAIVVALLATIFFSIMGISKRFFFITGTVGLGILLFAAWVQDNLLERAYFCLVALRITFFRKLTELGYKGMAGYTLNPSEEAAMRRLHTNVFLSLEIAFTIVIILFTAIFCACLLRRVHILPLVAVGSGVCTLFLYYGMTNENLGFAMIIAGLCGVLALSEYDRIFADRKTIAAVSELSEKLRPHRTELNYACRQSSSIGGFVGLGTTLLAAILLLIPSGVDKRMDDIPAISNPAAKLENYFVSLVRGQNPDFGSLLFSGVSAIDRRSTAFEKRSYSGTHVFTIGSDINIPVYLRNWVGTDYRDDTWNSPSYQQIAAYKTKFGDDFSPESMTSDLLWAMDETLTGLPDGRTYISHSDIGYVTARVDIRKFRPTANLVFFPSYSDQRLGMLEYGTKKPLQSSYTNYSDGICSSTAYVFLNEYSTVANLPLLRDPDFAYNLSNAVQESRIQLYTLCNIIERAGGIDASDESLIAEFENYRGLSSVMPYTSHASEPSETAEYYSLAHRYIYDMNDHERYRIIRLVGNLSDYTDYVRAVYLSGCENFDAFVSLARSIVFGNMPVYPDMDAFLAQNLKVMMIIDYLSKNMTYTLSPTAPDPNRPYVNAAETFLFDTHEGYCVQFATAAVMLLRALGIPARYAEGFIADDFEIDRAEDSTTRYTTKVLDKNAHAWIEVYFDYYGWVTYEATTPYMSDMYSGYIPSTSGSETSTVDTTPPDDTLPIETPPSETTVSVITEPIDTVAKQLPAGVITVSVIAAVIAVVVICLKARADGAEKKFDTLKKNAEISDIAACELNAKLYRLLRLCGLVPNSGEHITDFSVRVDELLGSISPVSFKKIGRAVEQIEFAPSHTTDDVRLAAEYCAFLRGYLLRTNSFSTRLWRKYILAL